jgi:TatD DNase family protein
MFVDTHCHLDEAVFDSDRGAVLTRAETAGVTRFVNPAYDMLSSRRVVAQAQLNMQISAAVGIHPNNIDCLTPGSLVELRTLAGASNVVAIGEIGLDYYWKTFSADDQRKAFIAQLELARDVSLPVIIHCRDAYDDILDVLENVHPNVPIVLHAFAGTGAHADRALAAGYYLGIGGPVTFKKAISLREIIKEAPHDQILLETDSPYLTPHPHRGKRNEPAYLVLSAHAVAHEWDTTIGETAQITTNNARRCFRLVS